MAQSKRLQQVASTIKRHMSAVLMFEGPNMYKDVLVTVTNVIMSSDLGIAKIYISVYGTEDKQSIVLIMEQNNKLLRQQLAHRIKKHVRRIPLIDFYLDDTLDEMYHLRDVFGKLRSEKAMGEEE